MSIPVIKLPWIKDLTKKLVQLEAETSAKQSTLDKMASQEKEKLSHLEAQNSSSQSKIISLEGKIKAYKHRDKMLNRNIKKRSNSEISEIESLTEKLVKLQGENASKQAVIDSVKAREDKLFSKLEEKIVKLKHNEKALTLYVAKTIEDLESSKNIKIDSSSLKSLIAEKEKKIEELEFDLDWYQKKDTSEMKGKIQYFHDHISQAEIAKLQIRLSDTKDENEKLCEQLTNLNKKNDRLNKLMKIRDAEIAVMKDCDVATSLDVTTAYDDTNSDKHSKSDSDY